MPYIIKRQDGKYLQILNNMVMWTSNLYYAEVYGSEDEEDNETEYERVKIEAFGRGEVVEIEFKIKE